MCGIAGLFLKTPELQPKLGALFSPMLREMSERGPDSAGIAVYRDVGRNAAGDPRHCKLSLYHADPAFDWDGLAHDLGAAAGIAVEVERLASHALLHATGAPAKLRAWLLAERPEVRIMSAGHSLEIYKEIGLPAAILERFAVPQMAGSHAIGHTRMATESAVTTEGAHPFNTGDDLCLVHNGSLSNHHQVKRWLQRRGDARFQTENDSEVAAGYLTYRLSEGASIAEALEAALTDLDGFYTFAVGTGDGFAVLRDPIACKPAVLAETDDWVAMASEFRAIARLPGVEQARVWEPAPGQVYSWGSE
ncbi:class II glutamine amidotransferase [Algihabitans albus]|uniref:class II glutamine amidotransferase n=1 Tax=Algihabitans albus TaxID=2164067 RepID=UPI000E5C8B7F|nr:glutamine amidotransferase family protein [Algihabitans albus]